MAGRGKADTFPTMKNTNHTRPAPQRATRHPQKAHRLMPRDEKQAPLAGAATRLMHKAHPHDFLALCFYPGMGDRSTAA